MNNEGTLQGKVALVTGGGRGIGRSICIAMAEAGARLVVIDVGASLDGKETDGNPAQAVVDEISVLGGEAIASTLSITDHDNARRIVETSIEQFRQIDILVNNAGILRDTLFHKMSWLDWSSVLNVHLHGSFNMSRAVAPHFRERNSGSFVHMTSSSALIGQVGQANYMAAKMGIVGLSRSIALDMARYGVRSNCISPFAWSRMITSLSTSTPEQIARIAKLQKVGPEKITPMAVYLASDLAQGVTGQIFVVRNNEIMLMSQPRPVRSVHYADGWTAKRISEVVGPAFRSSLVPLEVSNEYFSWDPI